MKSLGATHVVDRHLDSSALRSEIAKINSAPFEVVYDAVSYPDTQKAGYESLGPGGKIVLTLPSNLGDSHKDGKKVINVVGSPHIPANRDLEVGLWSNLSSYLAEGVIKVPVFPVLIFQHDL